MIAQLLNCSIKINVSKFPDCFNKKINLKQRQSHFDYFVNSKLLNVISFSEDAENTTFPISRNIANSTTVVLFCK
jgi:hypothetical protein